MKNAVPAIIGWLVFVTVNMCCQGGGERQASAPTAVAHFSFQQGTDGFVAVSGSGTNFWEPSTTAKGDGSLKMVLAEKAGDYRVESPEFALKPWMIYRVSMSNRADRGASVRMALRVNRDGGWQDVQSSMPPGMAEEVCLFGTFPDTAKARIQLTIVVPGKALGRSAVIDEINVEEYFPVVREEGINLYWNGGFETAEGMPPSGWGFWVKQPEKLEIVNQNPHGGQNCFRIQGKGTYPVLPTVPVLACRCYRVQYWVRGEGVIYPGLHKLAPLDEGMRLDTATRIGYGSGTEVKLQPDTWQKVELTTCSEDKGVIWIQPFFVLNGDWVCVDDIDTRSIK